MDEGWKIRLLVIEAGFVKVCYCPEPTGHAFWLPYKKGRNFIKWGTTEGLGELTRGPTENTRLEAITEDGVVPVRAIIDVMEVIQDTWTSHLNPDKQVSTSHPSNRTRRPG